MLSLEIDRYVAIHRKFGLNYNEVSRTLHLFARYAAGFGDEHLTVGRLRDWCSHASSPLRARYAYDTVRRFCVFMNAEDDRHEVPPAGAFGRGRQRRPSPYIFDTSQVAAILQAARELPTSGTIVAQTYACLFALLVATGMRISEALALQLDDITPDGLIVRRGKGGKSRLLPIQPSTRQALAQYVVGRQGAMCKTNDLFISRRGRAPTKLRAHVVFVEIVRKLGLRPQEVGTPGPRLHDLRHTFAVRSLEQCPHDRSAVANHIVALSTYLGHTSIAHTYWYLEATPILMRAIAAAGESSFVEGAQ
jgi:integrase